MTPTRAEFHVLLALMRGPRHGYGVMQDVEELSAGQLRLGPGTLYTAIKRLRASGLISECDADADRRRCYRLTRKGRIVKTTSVGGFLLLYLLAKLKPLRRRSLAASLR